jgi:hypothetical protein
LARDFLLERFQALPEAERQVLHARAERWFAGHGYAGADSLHRHEDACFHDAAVHADAGGDWLRAREHARRALPALIAQGRVQDAREWVERLPDICPRIASWALSIGERNTDALPRWRNRSCSRRDSPAAKRIVAARAAFTAAAYGDRAGCLPGLLAAWESILDVDPLDSLARANARANQCAACGPATTWCVNCWRRRLAVLEQTRGRPLAGPSVPVDRIEPPATGDPLRALAMLAPPRGNRRTPRRPAQLRGQRARRRRGGGPAGARPSPGRRTLARASHGPA